MGRLVILLVALAACFDQPRITADTTALDLPRGAGTDVTVMLEAQPLSIDELVWLVDDPTIVSVGRTSDGARLRVSALAEGITAVHVGSHGQVIDIPAHVAPPAVVQLWLEPAAVMTPLGNEVLVRATAIDTTNTIRDVSGLADWRVMNPDIATLAGNLVHGASAGSTMLQVDLDGAESSAPVTVY
jgi:hypothetical protein